MMDISDNLVYIMSEKECSSVYALFLLSQDQHIRKAIMKAMEMLKQ